MPELRDLSWLPQRELHDWVVGQRWFASKSREVTQLNVVESVPLRTESPILVLTLMEAVFAAGTHETYQVPLGLRAEDEGWSERVICTAGGWTVYEVPDAVPIATPADGITVLALTSTNITLDVKAPGTYRLRLRYTPYWQVERGSACALPREPFGTDLRVDRPGIVRLGFDVRLGTFVGAVLGSRGGCATSPPPAPR